MRFCISPQGKFLISTTVALGITMRLQENRCILRTNAEINHLFTRPSRIRTHEMDYASTPRSTRYWHSCRCFHHTKIFPFDGKRSLILVFSDNAPPIGRNTYGTRCLIEPIYDTSCVIMNATHVLFYDNETPACSI